MLVGMGLRGRRRATSIFDVAMLADQTAKFGPVASDFGIWWLLDRTTVYGPSTGTRCESQRVEAGSQVGDSRAR